MGKLHGSAILFFIFFCAASLFIPPAAIAGSDQTIALVMKALTNPFFAKMEQGAKNFAKENEIPLEVFGIINETDTSHQISIMESLISRNIRAIVLAPADSKKLIPVCKKAVGQGITIINIDNPLDSNLLIKAGLSIPFVGSNNQTGGELLGTYIKQQLKGKGRVLVIEGIRGVENAELRKSGFVKAVTKNSSIWVVGSESANWNTEEAFSVTMKFLQKYPSIDAIFCANDQMALGTLQAVDILDLNKNILIAGYDNIESVRNEIRHKKIHATMEQHPELMGAYGVMLAQKKINGEVVPDNLATPLDIITYETFGKNVAFSISDMKNPFFLSMAGGARKAAELYGVELTVKSAENNDSKQLMDLVDFQKNHSDLIILNPTHAESVVPGIEMAVMNKIPVITVDRKSAGGKILCHVASDNIEGGRMAAKLVADLLKNKGRIIEIEGIPGTSAAHDRGYGFNDEIKRFRDIEVIAREVANFDREQAKQVMVKLLAEKISFDAVFAHNDNMILGVADALADVELTQSKVLVGFDAIRDAVQAVKTKKISATIAQHPQEMGRMALEVTAKYFRGEEISSNIPVTLSVIR
ncbi:substrate-binding domain-containing protein [Desulfobacter curvatus]|uniref:substrate-binding domain-containing protein n=1 Tax=Desulfobacter curvatus TaxID=2290 RepID=UPI00036D5872|nr:substrate-binding domain-containing protein [Desulfobacter curvatus]